MLRIPVPVPGRHERAGVFHGSSDALGAAELALRARPLLVITENAWHAQRLLEEIPFFAPQLKVHIFPDWETLPYDHFSPHHDLVSERLATLYQIMHHAFDVAIVPVTTALYRLAPVEYLAGRTFFFKQGEKLAADELRRQLTLAGYSHVTQVLAPGEYCFRGGLIDLFPTGSAVPYRIDLLDDEIESIRSFDVDTQRSIYKVNEVRLLPAREFPLDEAGQTRFRRNFREKFEGDPSKSRVYKDVSKGIPTAGVEYYLPLFFDRSALITEYLPQNTLVCLHGSPAQAIEQFWSDTHARYAMLRGDRANPVLPPHELFLTADEFFGAIKPFARVEFFLAPSPSQEESITVTPTPGSSPGRAPALPPQGGGDLTSSETPLASRLSPLSPAEAGATAPLPPLAVERRVDNPLHRLQDFLNGFTGRTLILAESQGRRETMLEFFAEYGFKPPVCGDFAQFTAAAERVMLGAGPLHAGFSFPAGGFAVITENELYAAQARPRREREGRRATAEGMLRDLSEVKVGDPVVHEQHGIGRYRGLRTMDLGEGATEFLTLEYAAGDKLYVPVSSLHLISRYSGAAPEAAPLHQLGSGQWDKAKKKAARQVRDTAAELLNLYAQRALRQGYAFKLKQHDYEAFCEGFPFEETPDQAAAVNAALEDLKSGKPMDRLICGDVGFGKTEVALRAAFVAVADGKQVVVLVPTTLLTEQHFNTFSDRFAGWPVKIAELSRFRSAREQAEALEGLGEGRIDIAIGTHKLLSRDVKFANLGLVIIDEEHRFGVRQKEKLKALRAEVDVLTLTATPIPRTLAMSLEGLRDFSVIATAPQRRLAIKTFVSRYSKSLIREAVLRELKRGGQIYFLHNDIDTIEHVAQVLATLLPEARIRTAHGQMRERDLEHVMRDFYQQRFNVLLCTTIIETGIDVPTANTIIISRADKFGLAQLHQLRGRVGRSHHQAYAYLLLPEEGNVTAQAKKRLDAIQMMEELGSGFFLAMHDLEIRGAGEVLGEAQSGEMQEVGFNLYCAMLDAAVRSLKQGKEPDLTSPLGVTTEINLHVPALLPEDYVSDVHERLVLYKRLANCEDEAALSGLHEELIDRFGPLPDSARALLDSHRLRVLGKPLGIARIDATDAAIQLQFVPRPPIEPAKVLKLVQTRRNYRLAGQDRLRIDADLPDVKLRVAAIREVFGELG
ncbi:MAG: transcription-repair coupling factor [Betaproteobacteria bacterium RIFCSPLOWO2_12_FULL_62_58]|nr:MAG: transcription-repair coupling factor [Betaproteobacteria bacterium RIFCSPLOWO2_12_FULL_62_58]